MFFELKDLLVCHSIDPRLCKTLQQLMPLLPLHTSLQLLFIFLNNETNIAAVRPMDYRSCIGMPLTAVDIMPALFISTACSPVVYAIILTNVVDCRYLITLLRFNREVTGLSKAYLACFWQGIKLYFCSP